MNFKIIVTLCANQSAGCIINSMSQGTNTIRLIFLIFILLQLPPMDCVPLFYYDKDICNSVQYDEHNRLRESTFLNVEYNIYYLLLLMIIFDQTEY